MFLHHFICSVHFPTVQKHTGFETIPHLYWKNDKGVKSANGFQPAFSGHSVYSRVRIYRVRFPILLVVSWTGKMNISLSPCVPENLVSRDGFSRPVPRQPAHLHAQTESGAYLRDCSRVPRRHPLMKPPYAIGSVPSLSGHATAYRWRSLPRVRRHRASKPQGSSERVLPWQVTMDQLIFASLSHTHYYWYEVVIDYSMLKVPAV